MAGSGDHLKVDVHPDHPGPHQSKSQVPVHILMVISQLLSGVYYVITRVALVNGMNRIVLSLYRDILAMCILIPASYFIDKGNRLKLSWSVVLQLLLLGLTGIYGSNFLLFVGIEYTSAEVSAAIQPAIPVLTALLAIVFSVETVYWHRLDGQAKILGIVSSCSGACVMSFYKGPAVITLRNSLGNWLAPLGAVPVKHISTADFGALTLSDWHISGWQFGVFCLIGNAVCMATFINLQAPLLRKQPAPVSVLTYAYGFGALFMGITGYFVVKDPTDWALSWDVNLAAVIYNGVIAAALNFAIMSWCLNRVGPLFVSSYIPMQPVIAAILSLVFLDSTVFLGSILGSVLVFSGLLLVAWSREEADRLSSLARQIEGSQVVHKSEADALREPLVQVGH